jgi:hypothetical protein
LHLISGVNSGGNPAPQAPFRHVTIKRDPDHRRGGQRGACYGPELKLNFIFIHDRGQLMRPISPCPRPFRVIATLLLAAIAFAAPLPAQTASPKPDAVADGDGPIQDNSFLLEEAYNQEAGVVQHISVFTRFWTSQDWAYTFTQEWPVPGRPRHQLSYTAVVTSPGAYPGTGFGDTLLNYRYQVIGSGDTRIAFAPRVSLVAPTGASHLGRGYGGFGVQTNLPLSVVLTRTIVTHWNAGATIIPSARNAAGVRARSAGYNLGQSVIWQAKSRFNVMLETVWNGTEAVVAPSQTQRSHSLLISPGVRWAHNFKSGLQIVPGIAVPMGVGPSSGERGLILYLSFEHPWRRLYGTK